MDTANLVKRAQGGDREALEALFEVSRGWALAYARSLVPSLYAAQDAVQEAFVYASWHLDEVQQAEGFDAWLREIVRRRCLHATCEIRRVEALHCEYAEEPYDVGPDLLTGFQAHQIEEEIARFPEPQRTVAKLRFLCELSLREVSHVVSLPVDTVRNQVHTMRKNLRRRLGDEPAQPIVTYMFGADAATALQPLSAQSRLTCYTYLDTSPPISTIQSFELPSGSAIGPQEFQSSARNTMTYAAEQFPTTMTA